MEGTCREKQYNQAMLFHYSVNKHDHMMLQGFTSFVREVRTWSMYLIRTKSRKSMSTENIVQLIKKILSSYIAKDERG